MKPILPHPLAALALAVSLVPPVAAFIPEPETLLYGRILNRENPDAERLVTEGDLLWTIRKPDGSTVRLSGEIEEFDGGEKSYLLRVPHQAMSLGQEAADTTVPLGASTRTAAHVSVTVDGRPATILPPATSVFELDQLRRAGTARIDLALSAPSEDGDGDGLPDWWEDEHGLDKQDPGDALADANGDGLDNLAHFLAGTDPNRDGTEPKLLTTEVIAYAESISIILLEAADTDSAPEELTFTLHSPPSEGELALRDPGGETAPLSAGSTFTQADAAGGRLVYQHTAGEVPGVLDVSVADEDPDHPSDRGEVSVGLFAPHAETVAATAAESLRLESHRLARDSGHVVADLGASGGKHRLSAPTNAVPETEDRPHILIGGPSEDELRGGSADDFLHGGAGADTLGGGAGADTFVLLSPSAEETRVVDFSRAEGDRLDLTGLLDGDSALLTDYVRIRRSGADALVEVSAAGTATGFTDHVIRLENSTLEAGDVPDLYYGGHLEAGAIGLPPRVGVVASRPDASENGPTEGAFEITREGPAGEELTVHFSITGNATNGTDYQQLPPLVTFPEGETAATLRVLPYVDADHEPGEVARLELQASSDYLLADAASAEVRIEDLKPQLSFERLEELASVEDLRPGRLLMRREGLVDSEVFVRFSLAGSAVNGVDYEEVDPYVSLEAGQTSHLIEFTPKPDVDFDGAEGKVVRMSIEPDPAYVADPEPGRLLLVPRRVTLDGWAAEHEALVGGPLPATESPGDDVMMSYAFAPDGATSPDPAAFGRMPEIAMEDGHLVLRFRRKPGLADLDYRVEYTRDFESWTSGPETVEDITWRAAPDDPAAAVYRAREPMSASEAAAMRVRLVTPEDR